MITTGRAPRKMPIVDFGNLPLQKAKVTHVVLYNRTGIATPFSCWADLHGELLRYHEIPCRFL
jgi:hypothetical protein